jgi:hypothetical protein
LGFRVPYTDNAVVTRKECGRLLEMGLLRRLSDAYRTNTEIKENRAEAFRLRREDPDLYARILYAAVGEPGEAMARRDPDAWVALFLAHWEDGEAPPLPLDYDDDDDFARELAPLAVQHFVDTGRAGLVWDSLQAVIPSYKEGLKETEKIVTELRNKGAPFPEMELELEPPSVIRAYNLATDALSVSLVSVFPGDELDLEGRVAESHLDGSRRELPEGWARDYVL